MAGLGRGVRAGGSKRVRSFAAALAAVLLVTVSCTPTDGGSPTTTAPQGSVRVEVDRPDDTSLLQVKALYVLPADGVDRSFDTNGRIATALESVNQWFESEGGSRLRFDTHGGDLDIAFMRLEQTAAVVEALSSPLNALVPALVAAGFTDPDKSYLMFYEGFQDGVCGSAYRPGSEAGVYLHTPNCGQLGLSIPSPSWIDFTAIHEVFHNLGASPDCAPNKSTSGHVGDAANDLMYSGPLPRPLPRSLDVGSDDYWGHGRTDCVDVSRSRLLDPLPDLPDSPPGVSPDRGARGPITEALAPATP